MTEFYGFNISHNKDLVIDIPSDKSLSACVLVGEDYKDFSFTVSVKPSRSDTFFNLCILSDRYPHCSFQNSFSSNDSPVTFRVASGSSVLDSFVSLTGHWIRLNNPHSNVKPVDKAINLEILPSEYHTIPTSCEIESQLGLIPFEVIKKIDNVVLSSSSGNRKKKRKGETDFVDINGNTLSKIWNVQNYLNEGILIPEPKKISVNNLTGLYLTDYLIGKGKIPKLGSIISILYESYFESGELLESRMDRLNPFTFRKGTQQVIKGLDAGLSDMREGGSREILIPANLGYGEEGLPPSVPPNSNLIFRVTLLGDFIT